MVLLFRRFLVPLGMTDMLEKVEGRSGEAHTLNNCLIAILVRLTASSLYYNSHSVIPIEADEGGVVRNLQLYQMLTQKDVYKN